MKKLFILTITMMLCFTNIVFAESLDYIQTFMIYRRPDITSGKYLAANETAEKLVKVNEKTDTFTFGDTSIELIVKNTVDTTISEDGVDASQLGTMIVPAEKNVATYLDDTRFNAYLEEVKTSTVSEEEYEKKADELTNIANQIREKYKRISWSYIYYDEKGIPTVDNGFENTEETQGPNKAGLSNQYLLMNSYRTVGPELPELSEAFGSLLWWGNKTDSPVLVWHEDIWKYVGPDAIMGGGGAGGPDVEPGPGLVQKYNDAANQAMDEIEIDWTPIINDEDLINYLKELEKTGNEEQKAMAAQYLALIESKKDELLGVGIGKLQEPDDWHHYNGEFSNIHDARSAEYSVIEKCWDEGCAGKPKFIENFTMQTVDHLATNWKDIEFYLGSYYVQDGKGGYYADKYSNGNEFEDALCILTEYNESIFKKFYLEPMLEDVWVYSYTYNSNGKIVDQKINHSETEKKRQLLRIQVDQLINEIRAQYVRVGVVTEGYEEKDVYIYQGNKAPVTFDFSNTVFAQEDSKTNELPVIVAIQTDDYNDVFTYHILGGGMTDVINSKDPKSRFEGKDKYHYRLRMCNFYLCEKDSKCHECKEKLVACGEDNNSLIGVYFSDYCAEHACRFVWEWLVDKTNPGGCGNEGLKCTDQGFGVGKYCDLHTCDICNEAVVGVSLAKTGSDIRATGSEYPGDYSWYCVDHKCRWVGCQNNANNSNATISTYENNGNTYKQTDKCCSEHYRKCVNCEGPVPVAGTTGMECGCSTEQKGRNDDPPVTGKCAVCGKTKELYFGGSTCNGCYDTKLMPLVAGAQVEFNRVLREYLANQGIDGNGLGSKYEGLPITLYNANGELVSANAEIMTCRRQDAGLGYYRKKDGIDHYVYGTNCTDNVIANFALALTLGGGSIDVDTGKELGVNVYVAKTKDGDQTFAFPQITRKGSCMLWGHWCNTVVGNRGSSGMEGVNIKNKSDEEILTLMNKSMVIGTGDWHHTFMNTKVPTTFTYDGDTYSGFIYQNYGNGNGIGDDTAANDVCSFFCKDGKLYRAVFSVGKDGKWKLDPEKTKSYGSQYVHFVGNWKNNAY